MFGWSLEKTDLQYILELNEPCFVQLDFIPDSEEADIKCVNNSMNINCLRNEYLRTDRLLNEYMRTDCLINY